MRFECQPGCTNCCRREGFVYLTEEDLRSIAAFLEMSPEDFERRYVYRTRRLLRLRVPRGARCIFLEEHGCRIHDVKPTQCRIFPFWPEMAENAREFHAVGSYCPGIGRGELINIETAQNLAAEMRQAYPGLYERKR
jgi:uncharacterized protein